LDPDEHFDVIALILEPPASCCVCLFVWGGGIHYLIIISVIPSICISSLVVLNIINKGNNKLPNSEQSSKGKVKTHKYINRQNQSTKWEEEDVTVHFI
jgi:hypothetical protein